MIPNPSGNRPRNPKSRYLASRGKGAGVYQQLSSKWKEFRGDPRARKLNQMQNLPKSRIKRFIWRMQPAHLKEYWWSREGAVQATKITGIGILAAFLLMVSLFAFFRRDLQNIKDLSGSIGGSISYYDRTGKVLLFSDYEAVKRVPVASSEISQYMKDATVATEDRGFYTEPGFSPKGILRAALTNILHRETKQGGSTITEQLVKMTQNWTQDRTLARKVKELILAVDVERTYSKDDILTAYLNMAPYGGVDYGVQTAASDYFHTTAKKLTLPQAAMLAAIPKSPSYLSPYGPYYDKKALQNRYEYVLDSMVETKYITKEEAEAAKKVDVASKVYKQQTKYAGIRDPYFVLAAKNQILSEILKGGDNSTKVNGWKVTTTMDLDLQKLATKSVMDGLPKIKLNGGDEAAFVAEDVKSGQIVALVGGVDFNAPGYGQINFAQWPISPGSSFKPYDYTALINNTNAGAGSVLYDTAGPLPGYPCTNKSAPPPRGTGNCLADYDFRSPGPMTLRYALGGSRNIPAVKAMLQADPNDNSDTRASSVNKTIETANALMHAPNAYACFNDAAMNDQTQCYGSSALGDGAFLRLDQHVNGLASLARLGSAIPTTYILKIEDANNKPVYTWKQPTATQVVRPDAAYIVNDMASDPNASYLPGSCTSSSCTPLYAGGYKFHRHNGWHFAVKTGTTGNGFDGLMTSWSTQYAAVAWVGHHTRNVPLRTFMETLTAPIVRPWMEGAHDKLNKKPVNWSKPSGVQTLPAYVVRTHVGIGSREPSPATDLYPSWYKPRSAAAANSTIDKVSGRLATECTPPAAKQNLSGTASANSFSIDAFYGAGAISTNSGEDNVHSCSDAKPSINSIDVSGSNGSYTLEASATAGTHPLTGGKYGGTISFAINGTLAGTAKISSSGTAKLSYTNTKYTGKPTITATVTDSVLYESSSSTTSPTTFQKSGSVLTFSSAKVTGSETKFSWSGGSPSYTVYRTDNNQVLCSTSSTNCSTSVANAPATTSVKVKDSKNATATATVN